MSPARKRPEKHEPTKPEPDVLEIQDPGHTEDDFLSDLDRASTDQADEKLERAAELDRGSPRT